MKPSISYIRRWLRRVLTMVACSILNKRGASSKKIIFCSLGPEQRSRGYPSIDICPNTNTRNRRATNPTTVWRNSALRLAKGKDLVASEYVASDVYAVENFFIHCWCSGGADFRHSGHRNVDVDVVNASEWSSAS